MQLPYWVQVVQALGPTIIAVVAACIAGVITFRQWKTARDRVKLDLFEKRYAIYQHLTSLLATTLQHGTISYNEIHAFARNTRGLEFLFGSEVEDFIKSLTEKLVKLGYHKEQIAQGPDVANYDMHVERSYELILYVEKQLTSDARPIFEKYLSFSHLI